MWYFSGWDHNAVCMGSGEILMTEAEQSFEDKLSMEGLVRHTGWERLRGVNMKGQGKPGLWAWGKPAMNRNIHTKGSRQSHQRQVKVKNQTKDWMGEKSQAGKNAKLRLGRRRKGRTMWYSAVIGSIGSWVEDGQGREEKSARLTAAILLPSGFHLWESILRRAEQFSCSPAWRSVLLFPKEAGCQLPCALLVIPTDSVNGSAFTGRWSKCRSNKVWWEQELWVQWFFLAAFRWVIHKG